MTIIILSIFLKEAGMLVKKQVGTVNIRIKPDIHQRLKALCVKEGRFLGAYVNKILENFIQQIEKQQKSTADK